MKMMSFGSQSLNEKVEQFKTYLEEFIKALNTVQTGLEKLHKQETGTFFNCVEISQNFQSLSLGLKMH